MRWPRLDRRFLGSTIALVWGWMTMIAGVTSGRSLSEVGGLYIIVGALAYRSCKRRRLGLRESTLGRKAAEIVGVTLVICHACVGWVMAPQTAFNHPVYPVAVPLWVLIAYLVATFKKVKEPGTE